MRRRGPGIRPLIAVLLAVASALAIAGCTSRALMAPDGRYVYWASDSSAANRLGTSDLASTELPGIPGGQPLRAGLIAPDGTTGYAITRDGAITRQALPAGDPVGPSLATSIGPFDGLSPLAVISPDGATAILGDPRTDELVRVDLVGLAETASIASPGSVGFVETGAYGPDGAFAYALQHEPAPPGGASPFRIVRISAEPFALAGTSPLLSYDEVGTCFGVVLSADGAVGYAVCNSALVRFDTGTMGVTGTLALVNPLFVQSWSLMRSPDGERLYLLDTRVSVGLHTLDLAGMRELPVRPTTLPGTANWGVLSPDGRTIYLGNDTGYREQVGVAEAERLDVTTAGPGAVRVSAAATACTGSCAYDILDYRTVTLTAIPAAGASFSGWGGACSGTAAICTLAMSEARSATAAFTAPAATPATSTPAPPSNRVRALRSATHVGGDAITFTTTLQVPGPGRVRQSVAVVARGRRLGVGTVLCRATARPTVAGPVTLACSAGPRARAALARTTLRLRVTTAFRPVGGPPGTTRRIVVLGRTALPTPPPVTG